MVAFINTPFVIYRWCVFMKKYHKDQLKYMCDLLMSWACCDKMNGENTTPEARMGNITWFFSAFCIRVETILWRRLQKKICQSRKQWIEGAINESMIMRIIWGIITIDYCSMITSKQTTGSWPCAKKKRVDRGNVSEWKAFASSTMPWVNSPLPQFVGGDSWPRHGPVRPIMFGVCPDEGLWGGPSEPPACWVCLYFLLNT